MPKAHLMPVVRLTQDQIATEGDALHNVTILNTTTNESMWSGPAGQAPQTVATSTTVAAAVATVAIKDWQSSTAVENNEVRRATATAGTIEAGDLIRSNSARTTGATFNATEAGNWTEFSLDIVTSVAGKTGAVSLVAGDVGLGSVDNTSDASKPVSTVQQTALDAKAPIASPTFTGTVGGITKAMVGLGSADNTSDAAKPVSTATQTALNLKQDASTAATDAELTAHTGNVSNPHGVTKSQVGLGSADNTSDASKPISTATQTALNAKAGTAVATTSAAGLMAATDKSKLDGVATSAAAVATTGTPVMDGTAALGTATVAARSDHVHPSDTSRQATLVSGTNIKTLNSQSILGAGNISVGASAASVTVRGDGSGGTVTQVSNDRVHTFTADGSFVVPTGVSAVRVLAVGGGGGGGAGRYRGDAMGRPGGGGAAGGYIHNTSFSVTPGATIAVTVGAGGAGATDADDTNAGTGGLVGVDSTFGSLTAYGGGGGGGHHATDSNPWDVPADQGGSGGGSSNGSAGATQSAAASAAGNTGFSGGNGVLGTYTAGGGGGGAGGAGGNGNGTTGAAGAGGIGLANDITGTPVTYAVGGAGSHSIGTGHAGANATAIGGGGEGSCDGGSGGTVSALAAGAGAAGIVIVRYLYQSLDTPIYANNAAAIAGGVSLGGLYRTGADPDVLCVVH